MKKRILSILLALTMMLSMIPFVGLTVSADDYYSDLFNGKSADDLYGMGWSDQEQDCKSLSISGTEYSFSQLDTAGKPFPDDAPLENLVISGGAGFKFEEALLFDDGIYFDSLVRFCGDGDFLSVGVGDYAAGEDKMLAVSAVADEGEEPRLYVTAGLINFEGEFVNAIPFDCGKLSDYDVQDANDWCRLTIKCYRGIDPYGVYPGFRVFVNAIPVKVVSAYQFSDNASDLNYLTRVARLLAMDRELFPSMQVGVDSVSKICFSGSGAVDELRITSDVPEDGSGAPFTADPIPVIATVNGKECGTIEEVNSEVAAASEGAAIVLFDTIEGNLTISNCGSNTLDLNGFTINGDIIVENCSWLTISGGNAVFAGYIRANDSGIKIFDGTFSNPDCIEEFNDGSVLEIYGGRFAFDPSAYVADGKKVIHEGDYYVVHTHDFTDSYVINDNETHSLKCACGDVSTEKIKHSFDPTTGKCVCGAYVEYNLFTAPTTTADGQYLKIVYDDEGNVLNVEDPVVSFSDWYLRTMVQKQDAGDGKMEVRFISMLNGECLKDGKLNDYQYAGFTVTVGDTVIPLVTNEGYTSFKANEETVSIDKYSNNPADGVSDYFFLESTVFGAEIGKGEEITVTPYVMLMTGGTLSGETVSFTINDLK